jgi:hypothetical protein
VIVACQGRDVTVARMRIVLVLATALLGACTGVVDGDDIGPACEGADCADTMPDPGAQPQGLPTCDDVDARLRDDFGIVIKPGTLPFEGLPSEDISCGKRVKVYQMFVRAFSYERFPARLMVEDAFTMHLYKTSSPTRGSCSAYTPSGQAIQIRDLDACLDAVTDTSDPDFARVATFLNHETGHVITSRATALKTQFQEAGLSSKDPQCYDRGFVKTYSLRTTNPVSESFAESLALYLWNKKVGKYATISNFRTECPHTWAWIGMTVFGDKL